MNLKLLFAISTLSLACFTAYASPKAAEVAARRRISGTSIPQGGIVERTTSGKVFRITNSQIDYPAERFRKITMDLRYSSLLPLEVVDDGSIGTKTPLEAASELVTSNGVGAGVIIINRPDFPITLVSPDSRWGILNTALLKADNPPAEVFSDRFEKAYVNIIARVLGAGSSNFSGSVLQTFTDIRSLDSIKAKAIEPDAYNKMVDTAKTYGIDPITIATYRKACQQGWAPLPTNDIQRTIWKEVNAEKERGPINALQIKP